MRQAVVLAVVLALSVASTMPVWGQGQAAPGRLEEFLNAQGSYCLPDALGGCLLFTPPLPNALVFCHAVTGRCASIDYAGLVAAHAAGQGISLGTAITGTVTERRLPDGMVLVHVILRTSNAFTWVAEGFDIGDGLLALGHRVDEVLGGAEPAFAESVLTVSFLNGPPGSPLPDLVELAAAPRPGRRLVSLGVSAWVEGPLSTGSGVPVEGFGQIVRTGRPVGSAPDVQVDRLDLDNWAGRASLRPLGCCPSSATPGRASPPAVGVSIDASGE
jgi:hypothetical protein